MNDEAISSLIYFYYILGDDVDNDYIIGTDAGSLGLVTFGKHKVIHEKAHNGAINILKVTDAMEKIVIIISAGEDQIICFWDPKLMIIKKLDLSLSPLWKISDGYDHSARSIDVYACEQTHVVNSNKNDSESTAVMLLVATRNNEVVEVRLKTEYKGIKEQEDENEKFLMQQHAEALHVSHKSIIIKEMLFDYSLVFKYNPPNMGFSTSNFVLSYAGDIMLTFSSDYDMFFWDTRRDRLLFELRHAKRIKNVRFVGR